MSNTIIVTNDNLTKICRICLMEYEDMHSIFSEIQNVESLEEESTFLYEILMNISSIRVLANDGLPTTICTNCMELAHTSFKFQQQCNRSQEILEKYILHAKAGGEQSEAVKDEEVLNFLDANVSSSTRALVSDKCEMENVTSDAVFPYVECDKLGSAEETETKVLDAVKVAATEDNKRLRQRLALKRIQADTNVKEEPATYVMKVNENGLKLYECSFCRKTYKHSNSLKVHLRSHTLERPYVCNQCGKGFKQYGALTYHFRSHTGEQPYVCKICGKRYRQSGTLTAHMRIHTGQRPFLCSVCGRGFRQAPDLGYHMRTHTKERPYMCNVCGKTMRMQCHLVQHLRIHTGERPFKCMECSKAFPSSTRLKRHAIIHTGLKPYICEVCKKAFNRLSSLRVHAKIHTDERPHVCSFCGKGFIQAHALKTHMNLHYDEEIPKVQ
uniref:Protein krueppel n=1 Tax=Photinus pyralis TaxID=7054 RepID=A0A1Y1L2X6_PHOPY